MELELGLKITHTRDDITSTADLRISKDPFGPVFLSRETDHMFILIAHLKGFRRENIFIEINEDGNRIAISGEKPVQEMVMIGWIMCKKEVEIKAFRKVFRIPDVVDLERIKAKFNEQESTLRIIMKKKVNGICGVGIDEEKEAEEEPKMIKQEEPKLELVEKKDPEEAPKMEIAEKRDPEEAPKTEIVEGKIESSEEIDQLKAETREEVEKESEIGTEEPEAEEEQEIEDKIETEEAVANVIHDEPENVEPEVMQKEPQQPETETVDEPDQVLEGPIKIPEEKVEAPAAPPTFPEPEIMEPEVIEPQMTEMPSMEEPEKKEPPDDEIQKVPEPEEEPAKEETYDTAGRATQQSELPSSPPCQAEDEKIANEDDQAEGLTSEQSEEQESEVDAQDSKMEPEPDQEPKEAETPTQQQLEDESDKKESDQGMETENMAGEIGEETDQEEHGQENEGDMDTYPEIDAGKGPIEEAAMEEKRKKSKLRKPLMFAGSAFLMSLIVLVINLLRARKR
ncbi:hypothetical protein DITRI_Ditri03aG0137100 [Diplodiscus trichospermus]